jgi:peptidoglycan-N-acetylglucosamine deacetylase
MESNGKSFEQLKLLLDKAAKKGRWLILAGHEMDKQGRQTTNLSTLETLCRYISDPDNGIWIENVSTIYEYILEHRTNHLIQGKNQ